MNMQACLIETWYQIMIKREEVIGFCKTLTDVYEDYPFHDSNWTLMRCKQNKKTFAFIYEKDGYVWINLKCTQEWTEFWRSAFKSVLPAYHMNKTHWNSVVLDGSIPNTDVERMILESYDLVSPHKKKK